MAEKTVSQVTSNVNENNGIMSANPISFIEKNGEILFTSEEIGRQLGFAQPRKSINVIYNRNQKELNGYMRGIKMMSRDGQYREARCFTEEGVYILSMLAQTPNAREFRSRVAAMLRELRSSRFQHQLSLATESAYRQGYDEGRASALPDIIAAERKARAETARLLWPFGPVQKRQARKAARYRSMGLSQREIGRLLEIPLRSVQRILKAADALEAAKAALSVQGSLLELASAQPNGQRSA